MAKTHWIGGLRGRSGMASSKLAVFVSLAGTSSFRLLQDPFQAAMQTLPLTLFSFRSCHSQDDGHLARHQDLAWEKRRTRENDNMEKEEEDSGTLQATSDVHRESSFILCIYHTSFRQRGDRKRKKKAGGRRT
jgi:hypothetical protein